MANPLAVSLHASAAETASGSGSAVDVSLDAGGVSTYQRGAARLRLAVTAIGGTATPKLDVVVETRPNDTLPWVQVGAFTQVTVVGYQDLVVAALERYVRVSWVISGTNPSFTCEVSGTALAIYAMPADLWALSLSARALTGVSSDTVARALIASTDKFAGLIAGGQVMPLASWGDDVRQAVVDVTTYTLLTGAVGMRPGELDGSVKDRHDMALAWGAAIAAGKVTPEGMADATPDEYDAGAYVETDAPRGW